jgi:SAM-dependent methyltransferase
MRAAEVAKLAELEDEHWWYAERRALLARDVRGLDPGLAVDVGAAGGGNTAVLRDAGWRAVASELGATGAAIARHRGLATVRADARSLPFADGVMDLAVAFDVLEHIEDDDTAVAEIARVLRPGGLALVAVPVDMRLWGAHDVAVEHVRRYERPEALDLLRRHGFTIDRHRSWMVLLRPVVARRRRAGAGSDLERVPRSVNRALAFVVAAERRLPVGRLPGVSLRVRARSSLGGAGRSGPS